MSSKSKSSKKATTGKLTQTTFTTGWDDKLAAVDVYTRNPSDTNPTNSAPDTTTTSNADMIGIVQQAKSAATEYSKKIPSLDKKAFQYGYIVSNAIKEINKSGGFNSKNISDYVLKEVAKTKGYTGIDNISNVVNLSSGVNIKNVGAALGGQYKVILDGVELVRNGDFSTADSVVKLIGQVTGDTQLAKVINASDEMAMLHGLVDLSVKIKIPELATKIIDKVKTKRDKTALQKTAINAAADVGDAEYLQSIVIGNDGLDLDPTASKTVPTLLMNYTRSNTDINVSTQEYNSFVDMLRALDANWDKTDRDGKMITNLSVFQDCSLDAKKVLSLNPAYQAILLFSDKYHLDATFETFCMMYPNTRQVNIA